MNPIELLQLSPALAALAGERLMELGPGRQNEAARPALAALNVAGLCAPSKIVDQEAAAACLAGLWLLHEFHAESHAISQGLHTPEGSYWHAILHRREPDYANAKYWFRQFGGHAIFEPLRQAAKAECLAIAHLPPDASFLTSLPNWQPLRFVDLCQAASRGDETLELLCRKIQLVEWQLLFACCLRQATG